MENEKDTKECRLCFSEIDARATVCPFCRRDIRLGQPATRGKPQRKRKNIFIRWKYTPIILLLLTAICALAYLVGPVEDRATVKDSVRSLPPTYTPRGRSSEERPITEINNSLAGYDYESQQVLVGKIEIRGRELIAYLEQHGQNSIADNWGHLGIIHGVIAENELDVDTVRTLYVTDKDGFVVQMNDLLDFHHDRLSFDVFRARWRWFEP